MTGLSLWEIIERVIFLFQFFSLVDFWFFPFFAKHNTPPPKLFFKIFKYVRKFIRKNADKIKLFYTGENKVRIIKIGRKKEKICLHGIIRKNIISALLVFFHL